MFVQLIKTNKQTHSFILSQRILPLLDLEIGEKHYFSLEQLSLKMGAILEGPSQSLHL